MRRNTLSAHGKEDYPLPGLNAWTYGIWGEEYVNDTVAVVWPGIFSDARQSREMLDGILPSNIPKIYVNHRCHGRSDDCSDGIISYDGILEDIRKVSEFVREFGFKKHVQVYRSVSCPPGFVDMLRASYHELPMQDATIFISPPDDFYSYVHNLFQLGNHLASKEGMLSELASSGYCRLLKWYARAKFPQLKDGITRIGLMNIDRDPKGTLRGLDKFPHISEVYDTPGPLELEGKSTMVIYGDKDKTVPPEDMLRFAKTLERRGADARLVSIESGHRVTSSGETKIGDIEISVDKGKVKYLNERVCGWLDEIGILEPYGEQSLIDMENNIAAYSVFFKAEPDHFCIKLGRKGEGTLTSISQ